MSNEIFIDTFFIVALTNKRDAYHARALEFSDILDGQSVVTTDAVLLEVGNALARNFKREAVEIIDSFFNSPEIEIVHLTPELGAQSFAL